MLARILIALLGLPIYIPQRTIYAKSGAGRRKDRGVCRDTSNSRSGCLLRFARSAPFRQRRIGVTSRSVQLMYPAPFAGMTAITMVTSAAHDANLVGRSRTLAASSAELAGLDSVIVIWRRDYPAASVANESAVLERAGFHRAENWIGPLNMVVECVQR